MECSALIIILELMKVLNLNSVAEQPSKMCRLLSCMVHCSQIHTKFTYHHSTYQKTKTLAFSESISTLHTLRIVVFLK